MPPKEKSKKGGKQLQALAQLNAVQTTYKAACRVHGVTVNKGLAGQIEDAILEGSSIDKVSLSGPDTGPGAVKAALEVLAACPSVKNLALTGCSLGDEGLEAVAAMVRASSDRWWKGSRLRLLEVVADGAGRPLETWPVTCLAHMSGALDVQGQGHQQPNLLLDTSVPVITTETLQFQHAGLPAASMLRLEDEWLASASIAAPITTTMYQELEQARRDRGLRKQQELAAGVMAEPLPLSAYQSRPGMIKRTMTATASASAPDDLHARMARLASLVRGPQQEVAAEDLDSVSALPRSMSPAAHAFSSQGSLARQAGPGAGSLGSPSSIPASRGSEHDREDYKQRPSYLQAAGPDYLAGLHTGPLQPMTFGLKAMQSFSHALGSQGHGLQVLVLDHNHLGDMGCHTLVSGIRRCSTLTHLSLSHCGLGPAAASALCAVLSRDPDPLTQSQQPKLLLLNVSRNPLGGAGVELLCPGLTECGTLKVLNLSSCHLTEEDVPALKKLAAALSANPSIDNIDLDCNFFGDEGAEVFFPLLTADPHVRKFRVTARGMTRERGGQIGVLMKEHFPKKGKKKAGTLKKK